MSRRQQTDRERLEAVFTAASREECVVLREYVDLILRLRFKIQPVKRGRKRKPEVAPPLLMEAK